MTNSAHDNPQDVTRDKGEGLEVDRRDMLLIGGSLAAASAVSGAGFTSTAQAQQQTPTPSAQRTGLRRGQLHGRPGRIHHR
jgi:hypothetical protein